MTGRIAELATPDKLGRIVMSSGTSRFHFSYHHLIGIPECLTTGQLVSFELERGSPEVAVSVRPKGEGESSAEDRYNPREIRYLGFEQTDNIRSYKFQAWNPHEENQEAIVTVDIVLFRRHGIGIQEGPAISLELVKAAFLESGETKASVWRRALTDDEMHAYLASQPASRKSRKRIRS